MASKQFVGTIKTVKLGGDYPDLEVQVTFSMPLRDVGDLSFLAGVKQHGRAVFEVQSAQAELPLEPPDEPRFEQAQVFIGKNAPEPAARA